MVELPRRVLKRWRELSADSYKVRIELLFTSRLDPMAATEVLSQSVKRVLQDFAATHGDVPRGVEERFAGEWDVAPVPEGALLVGGYKSDAFEEVLQAVADDLSRNGVRGRLDLYALPDVPSLPATIGVVEARVRVLGRRVANGRDRWAADRAALHRVLEAATRWCLQARPDRGVTLQDGAMPALLVRRCDSALARLRGVMGDSGWVTLRSVGDDRFRTVTVAPAEGRVTVVEGGAVLHRAGWRPSVAAVTEFVRLVSVEAVYGFVRRVAALSEAEFASPSATDWLRRSSLDAIAHEEHRAPDAYPIQLLGPRYAGRIPGGGDWRATELAGGRVLLEHLDLAAWFDEVTIEQALRGESVPGRAVVERARASFAPILFADATKEERQRQHEWSIAHPHVRLPEQIVAKVHALPETPYVGHWDVAFVLRDGSVVDHVELGFLGEIVMRIAGEEEFSLDPDDIVDVLDRSRR